MNQFDEIEEVYNASDAAGSEGWQVFQIAWPAFQHYHQLLRKLEVCLLDHDLLDELSVFLAFSKRFQFFLSTTPLAPSALLDAMRGWQKTPSPSLVQQKAAFPESVNQMVDKVSQSMEVLRQEPVSPLWKVAMTEALALHKDGATIAVYYSDNRLGSLLGNLVSSHDADLLDFHLVRATDLKQPWIYDQLMVFGPTRRKFDDGSGFIFKSPRANLLTLFVPDCFRADIPSPYDFAGSPHRSDHNKILLENGSFKQSVIQHRNPYEINSSNLNLIPSDVTDTDDDWLNVIPVPNVKYRLSNERRLQGEEKMDTIAAKQVFLSADHVVYLPDDGSVYRLVDNVDPDSGKRFCQGVEHVEVNEIGPGDILLFSEEGGGKMIYDVANQILGDNAKILRTIQSTWKDTYSKKAADSYAHEIIFELKELGAKSVTPSMIHNWRSPLNIGPGSWLNFDALLKYCALEQDREKIFQATRFIRSAHIQAGARLSGLLLESMRDKSLEQLHSDGRQVFGGTKKMQTQKIAFFVQGVAPVSLEVSPNDIAKPIPIEEGSWL